MKLLDKPLTQQQKENEHDSLKGNIIRLLITQDIEEIISSVGFAHDRLNILAYSRIKEILEIQKKRN